MFYILKKDKYSKYPSIDYLNNAIRILLNEKCNNSIISAIREICYAIEKENGTFHNDVKKELISRNYWPCPWKGEL